MTESADPLQQPLRVMQSIVLGLAAGPVALTFVALVVLPAGEPVDGPITKIALVGALGALFLSGPVGRLMRSKAAAAAHPIPAYQVALLVTLAILEGGVFLNLIAHIQERSPWTLAMAGLLWVALLFKTPTRRGLEAWLAQQAKAARDESHLAGS